MSRDYNPSPIHAMLRQDNDEIGELTAFRMDPVHDPADDDVCTYTWVVAAKGQPDRSGTVQHRHGDGPWSLIARIAEQAADTP